MRIGFPVRACIAMAATLALAACSSAPQSTSAESSAPAGETPVASAPAPASTAAPPAMTTSCNADAAKAAVGKKATDEVIEQARVAAGATVARALRPDMMITMEYRGDRLNLRTDTSDVVVGVSCG
jgi:hypothetical protein